MVMGPRGQEGLQQPQSPHWLFLSLFLGARLACGCAHSDSKSALVLKDGATRSARSEAAEWCSKCGKYPF